MSMEFVAMLCMIFIVLSTTFPISSSIRSSIQTSSNFVAPTETPDSKHKPILASTTKSNRTGYTFQLLHRNHPKVVRQLGQLDEFAPISKNGGIYLVTFLVGSEKESILAVFDTGSSFTWVKRNKTSTSFAPLPCQDFMCPSAPNSYCEDLSNRCIYETEYRDGTTSTGLVGKDWFHYYKSDGPADFSSTLEVENVFGTAWTASAHDGVMGVTNQNLGILKALDEYAFSACFPRSDAAISSLRIGDDAYLRGESTPLVWDGFGHFAFSVSSIEINGLQLTNLTGGDTPGGTFVFDTGAAMTWFPPAAMDGIVALLKESINARPLDRPVGGYELCYESEFKKTYANLAFTLNIEGGTTIKFNFDNLWKGVQLTAHCLVFGRSKPSMKRTIYGAMQMKGWNFGVDFQENKIWIQQDDDCVQ